MADISSHTLRELRRRQHLSQEQLADKAGVNKATIYRIESGKEGDRRGTTIKRLALVLGVSPDVLTGKKEIPEEKPAVQKAGFRLSDKCRNALELVARRYSPFVREEAILEMAPFLFYLAAEKSLLRRRKNLAKWEEAEKKLSDMGKDDFPHMFSVNFGGRYFFEMYGYGERGESDSIEARDIFAVSEDFFYDDFDQFEYDAKNNPFYLFLCEEVRALREESKELGVKEELLPNAKLNILGQYLPIPEYAICREEAEALTGGDNGATVAINLGLAPLHERPKELKSKDADPKQVAAWAKKRLRQWAEERNREEELVKKEEKAQKKGGQS